MTPYTLRQARLRLGMSQTDMAKAIGYSLSMYKLFERGRQFGSEEPVEIPKTVELAVAALLHGLTGVPDLPEPPKKKLTGRNR